MSNRAGGTKFDREIPIRHSVDGVFAQTVESQFFCYPLAVDRKCGASQCAGAQWQPVDSAPSVGETRGISFHHFVIRKQVMRETHRLRDLQVGEARHQRLGVLRGQIEQAGLKAANQGDDFVACPAQIEPDIGGYLVVSRAPGMQSLSRVADQIGQAFFDVEVDILKVDGPGKLIGANFLANLRHAALDIGKIPR